MCCGYFPTLNYIYQNNLNNMTNNLESKVKKRSIKGLLISTGTIVVGGVIGHHFGEDIAYVLSAPYTPATEVVDKISGIVGTLGGMYVGSLAAIPILRTLYKKNK